MQVPILQNDDLRLTASRSCSARESARRQQAVGAVEQRAEVQALRGRLAQVCLIISDFSYA